MSEIAENRLENMEVVPSGGVLGAEVRGVDLALPIPDDVARAMVEAWNEHLVLLVRDQDLTDDRLVAYGRRFGEPHTCEGMEYGGKPRELPPEVELISNIVRDGRPIGALGAGEATWHTDMSMYDIPASATMLYAEIVPPAGGNTMFTNNRRAWERLPETLKRAVEGRLSIHDIAYKADGELRAGQKEVTDKSKGPGARHPVVRTHPDTGKNALYLGRQGYGYIYGYSVEESDRLLEELWSRILAPDNIWEHEWRQGDVLIWDNRSVAHARRSFDASQQRLMRRITIQGERPFYAGPSPVDIAPELA
jgi:taurine dioxygenase